MKIYLASDHHGFKIKEDILKFLMQKNFDVVDLGDKELNPDDDYPIFAKKAVHALLTDEDSNSKAILLCGSGQGMCIAANRYKGIRAALCWNPKMAHVARNDDDVNVLCLSADHTSKEDIMDTTLTFLSTPFANAARFVRRINEIDQVED